MNLDHYQHLALRTDMSRELPPSARILYHTAKLVEEVHEVLDAARHGKWAHVREERGDVMWHIVCLADARCLTASEAIVDVIPTHDPVRFVLQYLSETAKELGQGKAPKMSTEGALSALWHWAVGDESWMVLAAENIRKLEGRYGGK
jgi:uncharacterized protein YabN with tetrapyrrole methylase and pyrophosphatase domain